MPVIFAILLLVFATTAARAHGVAPLQPDALWGAWSFEASVLVPLLLMHWLYGRGVFRLWRQVGNSRSLKPRHVALFGAGEIVLFVALVSPLDALGGTLLSAHMLQHMLLLVVAPPLLLAGKPGVAIAWAMPDRRRRGILIALWRPLAHARRAMVRPMPVAALHGMTLWMWHAPVLFVAALESDLVHWIEHATFFASGMLLWQTVLSPRDRRDAALALAAVLLTLIHSGLLGALLTLAPQLFYPWYGERAQLRGLDPLDDQQLAGLIMWVPMGAAYLIAGLILAARMLEVAASPGRGRNQPRERAFSQTHLPRTNSC